MKAKLIKFYVEDMAPEIIDPIFSRVHKFRIQKSDKLQWIKLRIEGAKETEILWCFSTIGKYAL